MAIQRLGNVQRGVGLAAVVALLLAIALFFPNFAKGEVAPGSVSISAPASVASGNTFIARVNVGVVTNFDTGQFDVLFDSAVLAIDDITPGVDIINGDIGGTAIPVEATNQLAPGTVRVITNVPGTPGVSGAGFLADIRFRAVGAGGTFSTIDLTNLVLVDNLANTIPSSFAGPVTVNVEAPPPPMWDFGDAPDPFVPPPDFPSRLASDGARHQDPFTAFLGNLVTGCASVEVDSKQVNKDDCDDGLRGIAPLKFEVANANFNGDLYVNALSDLNGDGDWADTGEWVLKNFV
ncbi:MAG: hypothetical protein HYX93_03240, partial [Chloroflexi bacterium]|nr:hypothetical protein [Chloroflexota bacterium]